MRLVASRWILWGSVEPGFTRSFHVAGTPFAQGALIYMCLIKTYSFFGTDCTRIEIVRQLTRRQ